MNGSLPNGSKEMRRVNSRHITVALSRLPISTSGMERAGEVWEETGYTLDPADMTFLTPVGPAIYRSELTLDANNWLQLQISGEEAEPTVAFAVPLFLCNITGLTAGAETDREVKDQRWMTARQIVAEYGSKEINSPYSPFNYLQMFVPILLFLATRR